MQSTDAKTKSKTKKVIIYVLCVVIALSVLLISFGGRLGIPSWNDVFVFCKVYADLGDEFSASFVNVGNADACCIRCNGKSILVDSGTKLSYDKLSAYLRRNNFDKFDAVIISHPDSDHIGGMSELINDFSVDAIYMPLLPDNLLPQTKTYKEFDNSIKENNIEIIHPKAGDELAIGDMRLNFISPSKSYDEINDYSLVFKLLYKETSFLFTGDITENVEEDLLNSNIELNSDVLKVAHHGSKSSSTEDFLRAVTPQVSVVSVSVSNELLPDYNTMAYVNHYSESLYSTAKDKTIVVTSDGKNLKVQTNA